MYKYIYSFKEKYHNVRGTPNKTLSASFSGEAGAQRNFHDELDKNVKIKISSNKRF